MQFCRIPTGADLAALLERRYDFFCMNATVLDFHQLVRTLEEHPEWRAELRRLVLSDELLTVPESVRELAAAQQRTEQRLAELAEAQRRTEQRIDELAAAQQRTEQRLAELAEAQRRTEQRVDELAAAQQRTEEALRHLVGRVDVLTDQVGELRGEAVERRYRERAHAYFGRIVQRLRVLSPQDLADLVDDAKEAGRISEDERRAVLWSDVVVEGRGTEGERLALVVEVSATIQRRDVERAVQRAAIFAKATGRTAWPAVAGEGLAEGVHDLAQRAGVWQVLDGRILPPIET